MHTVKTYYAYNRLTQRYEHIDGTLVRRYEGYCDVIITPMTVTDSENVIPVNDVKEGSFGQGANQ